MKHIYDWDEEFDRENEEKAEVAAYGEDPNPKEVSEWAILCFLCRWAFRAFILVFALTVIFHD